MNFKNQKLIAFLFFMILTNITFSQSLVYKPINPSFAMGETFNASWLLASAQAQNDINESFNKSSYQRDILEEFSSSLNRSLLSQLSKKILGDTFGEDTMTEGVYEFDSFNVEITNVTDGLSVRVIDTSTGNETEIIIPYF